MSSPKVTAIVLASRPRALARCLANLAAARPAQADECLVVLNGRDAECAAAAQRFAGRLPGLRVVRDAPRSLGGARNAAARRASGEWLCFFDDDVVVPESYFAVLLGKAWRYPEAAVIGGPNLTPPGSGLASRCIGHVLGSWLCAGPMRRRYAGFARDRWCDDRGLILCALCFKREALARTGLLFDEELAHNEENLLLERLLRSGGLALHSPELFVLHERRTSLAGFSRQCFLSGVGRAEMTIKLPVSLSPLHLAPLLLGLALPGLLWKPAWAAFFMGTYAALAALNALQLAARHDEGPAAWFWLAVLHPAAHLGYALGLMTGLVGGLARRCRWAPALEAEAASHAS